MTQSVGRYAAATAVAVGIMGALLMMAFHGPDDAMAIWTSAVVAVAVQVGASALGRMVGGSVNLMARMGIGALLRFLTLAVYAVLVVTVVHLPHVAALISLVTFLFLSSLIEPLFNRS
jgi:hypothetical protein